METKLVSLMGLKRALHLPAVWLKAEALAGRIPSLKAGNRLLFNAEAVERALLDRAAGIETQKGCDHE